MKATGILHNLQRLPSSTHGNPRYSFVVGNDEIRTSPNSGLAYELPNFDLEHVIVEFRDLRGFATLTSIKRSVKMTNTSSDKETNHADAIAALKLWKAFWDDMPKGQLCKIVCDIGLLNDAFLATSKALRNASSEE